MSNLEMKLDAVLRLCTTDDKKEADAIRGDLRRMMAADGTPHPEPAVLDPETEVRNILLEMGAPDHLIGHPYAVQAVLLCMEDRKYLDNITFGLYPALAVRFDATASRVERAIRHVIEITWKRGDYDALNRYFGNTIDPDKGKPTNSEFFARIANIVKLRMKNAAMN